MDYSKEIKSFLENNDFQRVLNELKLDKDLILKSIKNEPNLCCSNSSFLFIYLEQEAIFLAFSLNRLCKSKEDDSFLHSFQVNFNLLFYFSRTFKFGLTDNA
jgi:hypothetical protein